MTLESIETSYIYYHFNFFKFLISLDNFCDFKQMVEIQIIIHFLIFHPIKSLNVTRRPSS